MSKDFAITELKIKNSVKDICFIVGRFSDFAKQYNLRIETCAEKTDPQRFGISHAKCIDGNLIEKITGYIICGKNKRDGSRLFCGCIKRIDIGQYGGCVHGHTYCYANAYKNKAFENYGNHNPKSPVLFGKLMQKP